MKSKNLYYTVSAIVFTLLTLGGMVYLVYTINNRAEINAVKVRLLLHEALMTELIHGQFAFFHEKEMRHVRAFHALITRALPPLEAPLVKKVFNLSIHCDTPSETLKALTAHIHETIRVHRDIYAYQETLGFHHNHGLYGTLRAHVHQLEAKLKAYGDLNATVVMLQLRRNEKDFMLRGLDSYVENFEKNAAQLHRLLSQSKHASTLLSFLHDYVEAFRAFVYYYRILEGNSGLMAKSKALSQQFTQMYEQLSGDTTAQIEAIEAQEKVAIIITTVSLLLLVVSIMLSRREIHDANERNPLTGLNGNNRINEHIEWIARHHTNRMLIYFDFDYFKPFNDTFGFKKGDEMILAFSQMLKDIFGIKYHFIGHIGGDDFIVIAEKSQFDKALQRVHLIQEQFTKKARSYSTKRGFYRPKRPLRGNALFAAFKRERFDDRTKKTENRRRYRCHFKSLFRAKNPCKKICRKRGFPTVTLPSVQVCESKSPARNQIPTLWPYHTPPPFLPLRQA